MRRSYLLAAIISAMLVLAIMQGNGPPSSKEVVQVAAFAAPSFTAHAAMYMIPSKAMPETMFTLANNNDLVVTNTAVNNGQAVAQDAIFTKATGGAHRARDADNHEQQLVVNANSGGTIANTNRAQQLRC